MKNKKITYTVLIVKPLYGAITSYSIKTSSFLLITSHFDYYLVFIKENQISPVVYTRIKAIHEFLKRF